MKVAVGFIHRCAWAVVIGMLTTFAFVLPYEGHRRLAEAIVQLDWPVSLVGRLLPTSGRGIQAFCLPGGVCRGVAPDLYRIGLNQILLSILVYVPLLYLPNLAIMLRSRRHANA